MDFLIDEAQILDEGRLGDWLGRLSQDIFYWMPVRRTVSRRSDQSPFDHQMAYLFETYPSLEMRIKRVPFESAYSEDPPSRFRRLVTNLVVHTSERDDEWIADSSFLLLRGRDDERDDQLSGRREDVIRRTADGLRIAQRTILIDQTLIRTPNLGFFL